jgi:hypothetical protein
VNQMPICTICQADGVLIVVDKWYCRDHLAEAFEGLGRVVAQILDWDEDETVDQLREWYYEGGDDG